MQQGDTFNIHLYYELYVMDFHDLVMEKSWNRILLNVQKPCFKVVAYIKYTLYILLVMKIMVASIEDYIYNNIVSTCIKQGILIQSDLHFVEIYLQICPSLILLIFCSTILKITMPCFLNRL